MALKRELGFPDVFAVAAGAMISSGLFVLPATLFEKVGSGVFLCYLGAAVLLVPALLSKAELATAMPKAGGTFYFIDRSLGPGFGTVGGIAAWASLSLKSAFALWGLGLLAATALNVNYADHIWLVKSMACGGCLVFMALNLLGVRHTGRVQIALVAMLLVVLVGFVIWGAGSFQGDHYRTVIPDDPYKLLAGVAMVFIAFGGVTKAATLGEEVRDPRRDLVLGMFWACAVVGALYVAVAFVAVGVLPTEAREWTPAPLSQAAGLFWGRPGLWLLGAAALMAFVTTANAGILSASRTIMAMGRDRLLPKTLGSVGSRTGTPALAVLFTGLFMMATIAFLPLELFVKAASGMKIMLFMFTMLSLILMRESRIATYSPSWRCPLYPWLQVGGLLAYAFLLVELGSEPLAVAALILGGAIVWYVLFARVRVMRESALVRLAARLAVPSLGGKKVEGELARIAGDKARVEQDRFDRLVADCAILDLPDVSSRQELFEAAADRLAGGLALTAEQAGRLLREREAISSTVIRPGLAIPHFVREGIGPLQMVVARSRCGVDFSPGQPPVHAVFVLAAPPEERNLYLKTLMAIAEIAQDPGFDRCWREAGSVAALRAVLLTAERRRNRVADHSDGPEDEPL